MFARSFACLIDCLSCVNVFVCLVARCVLVVCDYTCACLCVVCLCVCLHDWLFMCCSVGILACLFACLFFLASLHDCACVCGFWLYARVIVLVVCLFVCIVCLVGCLSFFVYMFM